jgi:hypothetical protein
MRQQVGKATSLRREIHTLGDDSESLKRATLRAADDAIHDARLIGDAAIHAFFSEDNDKKRNQRREELYKSTVQPAQKGDSLALNQLQQLSDTLRSGDKPVTPFHWEIEFPEVFDRDNPGFDCFMGNPPFLGGAKVWPLFGECYRDYLLHLHETSNAKADITAHFFRRCFHLLRNLGSVGLITTNSIAQGATRESGLTWMCTHDGSIYEASRRVPWPGRASVIVSIIHMKKGGSPTQRILDGKPVNTISAFLFDSALNAAPHRLRANMSKAFLGCKIYGQGFLFSDDDPESTPIVEMHRLIKNPENRDRIFPYLGGEDLNSSPNQTSGRYAICFEDMPLEHAQRWPDLLQIIEQKVKPLRAKLGGYSVAEGRSQRWWQYGTYTPGMYKAIAHMEQVLVIARVSRTGAFCFVPSRQILNEKIVTFAFDQSSNFAVLQSRIHEVWARFFNTTLKDDMQYSAQDCFENFPLPNDVQNIDLHRTGKHYHDFRAALMIGSNEGLTTTYNRFHDPDEQYPGILKLRELHAEMDRAVLTAYGWTDLAERATCEFRLDYEDDDELSDDDAPRARAKKKPWRYRWPQDFHDEVLARLLDLNQQRAKEEQLAGAAADAAKPAKKKTAKATAKTTSKRTTKSAAATQTKLIPSDD